MSGNIQGVAEAVLTKIKSSPLGSVRERLAARPMPDERQRRFTAVVVIAVIAAGGYAWWRHIEQPVLLGGLAAVFALVATGGQSLRADMRRFAWFGPVLVLVVGCGPLFAGIPPVAGVLVAITVFSAGMLPALGERYRVAGQVLAAATLASTTTGLGAEAPLVSLATAVIGIAVAFVLRVLVGRGDPNKAVRVAVARTLTSPGAGSVEYAASLWRADASRMWLGEVLAGAARFRAAKETLLAQSESTDRTEAGRLRQIAAEADLVAAELAKAVEARVCTALPALARVDPATQVLRHGGRQDLPEAVVAMREGLDRIRAAVVNRIEVPATTPARGGRWRRVTGAVRAHLSPRSSLFRHALRCTLAVAIGLIVLQWMRDPSASVMLLALYAVLHPASRDNMAGALTRTGGAVLGVVLLAAIVPLIPYGTVLLAILVAAMMLGAARLRTDHQLLVIGLVSAVVAAGALEIDRPVANIAISFAATTAIGATIAMVVGYVSYLVLPGSMVPDVQGMLRSSIWSVSELLRSVRATSRGQGRQSTATSAHVLALRRTQDLLGLPAQLDGEADPDEERAVQDAAIALDALRQDVASLAFRPESEQSLALPALQSADELLGGSSTARIPDCPSDRSPATELLASSLVENALHARRAIDEVIGPETPWRSYTISFIRPEKMYIR